MTEPDMSEEFDTPQEAIDAAIRDGLVVEDADGALHMTPKGYAALRAERQRRGES